MAYAMDGSKKDVKYGQGILQVMRPFIESLIASGLSVKTIKRHMDNLWVLGGEIIRDVNTYDEYDEISPLEKTQASVDPSGGPIAGIGYGNLKKIIRLYMP